MVGALCVGVLLSARPARADLIDLGNGMIYDTVQDLTWLQDLTFVQTSGFDADGRLTYDQAAAYVAGLSFGGYDDWRLPQSRNNELGKFSDDEITSLVAQLGGHFSEDITIGGALRSYALPTSWSPFTGPLMGPSGEFRAVWLAAMPGSQQCLPTPVNCFSWMGWTTVDLSAFHWDRTTPGPTVWAVRDGLARVPEPSTWLLVGLGTLTFLRRRRTV
jgi:hypothetical protein